MTGSPTFMADVRKINKQKLMNFIKSNSQMDIEKILGVFSLQTGLKISTLKIYVYELRQAGVLE